MSDPIAAAQKHLAELHADVLREEVRLRKMHGADHFHQPMAQALPHLGNDGLDNDREAGAPMDPTFAGLVFPNFSRSS